MFNVNAAKPLHHGASKIFLQLTSTFLCSKLVAQNCLRIDASSMTVHFQPSPAKEQISLRDGTK